MRKLKVGKKYKLVGINPESCWNKMSRLSDLIGQTFIMLENDTYHNTSGKLGRFEAVGTVRMLTGPLLAQEIYIIGFSAHAIRDYEVCTCGAYKFPHRKGSGDCQADQGPFCGECGEPCRWKCTPGRFFRKAISRCCGGDVYMDVQMTELAAIDCDGDLI